MLLSKSCVYGMRAGLYLASHSNRQYTSIKEMSGKLDISFHFLTKILQQLNGAGLVESQKGPNGGVRLTRSGEEVSLFDIVVAIDGKELFTECALGLPGCGMGRPCPLHEKWAGTREGIRKMLETTKLVKLARRGKVMNFRLTADGDIDW